MTATALIGHPEQMNRETLFALRELVARYPYYQLARLLYLQNLFLLHDPAFGEELRRAALYMPSRRVLFNLVEGDNYEIRSAVAEPAATPADEQGGSRTTALIDRFLDQEGAPQPAAPRRQPTAIDATTDYAAFLLQMDDAEPASRAKTPADEARSKREGGLIDSFISHPIGRIVLHDAPVAATLQGSAAAPQGEPRATAPAPVPVPAPAPAPPAAAAEESGEEDYFTETLAKIYIKQGRYEKALEIIQRLYLNYPRKNRYFADQIRFLEKLVLNSRQTAAASAAVPEVRNQ